MTDMRDETRPERGLVEQASAHAQDAASVAQEKTKELRAQGSKKLREQFDRRSTDAGSQARSVAEVLRRSGTDLRSEDKHGMADLTDQAARRIDHLGEYLEQKSGGEIMRDVENFARRRPWTIAGLGLVAGIVASRFVKASAERRYPGESYSTASSGYRQGPGGGALPDREIER
jgi:hypothetical protein